MATRNGIEQSSLESEQSSLTLPGRTGGRIPAESQQMEFVVNDNKEALSDTSSSNESVSNTRMFARKMTTRSPLRENKNRNDKNEESLPPTANCDSNRGSMKIHATINPGVVPAPVKNQTNEERRSWTKVGVLSTKDYGYGDINPNEPKEAPQQAFDIELDQQLDLFVVDHESRRFKSIRRPFLHRVSMPHIPRRSSLRSTQDGTPRRNSIEPKGFIEITLPSGKKVLRRTSLTFNEEAHVVMIKPAKDLTKKEDLWLQDDEMGEIRRKVAALIEKTDGGLEPNSGKKYCVRGLERFIDSELVARKRDLAWDAVFNEQYFQHREGVFVDDDIANLYGCVSRRSVADACKRGAADEEEVKQYLSSTRRMCRRISV